jgi:hypothetical protein
LDPAGLLAYAFLVLIPFSVFGFPFSVEQPPRLLGSEKLTVGRALRAVIDLHQ